MSEFMRKKVAGVRDMNAWDSYRKVGNVAACSNIVGMGRKARGETGA